MDGFEALKERMGMGGSPRGKTAVHDVSPQPTQPDPESRRDDSPRVFTDYLRSLDPAGEPPGARGFERVWRALRILLRSEIRRRGLWRSPPGFLGVFGWRSWQRTGHGGDALDELVADCYTFVFVQRLRVLRAQLERKPHIEGLVVRCARNFLYDVQKRHDPLGFRVFSLVKTALLRALDAGELWVISGSPKIGGDTVLACRPTVEAATADFAALDGIARTWNDDLLPDLLTARGKAREALIDRIHRRLTGLRQEGVEAFRSKDVINALKADARARWSAVLSWTGSDLAHETEDGEVARVVRLIQPDTSFEDHDRFDQLLACVSEGLDRSRLRRRTREHLWTLWRFLRTFAAEAGGEGDGDRLPSRRELSRQLGIPRDRFTGLYATLRQLLEQCSEAISGNSKVITFESPERHRRRDG